MYITAAEVHRSAKKNKERFILGGDFNAEVGEKDETDNSVALGMFGHGSENSRGQWLKSWCELEDLVLTNTFFSKQPRHRITYTSH